MSKSKEISLAIKIKINITDDGVSAEATSNGQKLNAKVDVPKDCRGKMTNEKLTDLVLTAIIARISRAIWKK